MFRIGAKKTLFCQDLLCWYYIVYMVFKTAFFSIGRSTNPVVDFQPTCSPGSRTRSVNNWKQDKNHFSYRTCPFTSASVAADRCLIFHCCRWSVTFLNKAKEFSGSRGLKYIWFSSWVSGIRLLILHSFEVLQQCVLWRMLLSSWQTNRRRKEKGSFSAYALLYLPNASLGLLSVFQTRLP